MTHSKLSLGVSKKIKRSATISTILKRGSRKTASPIRLHYLWVSNAFKTRTRFEVAVIVPKRLFRKAVDRNIIKRWIREAIRIHQYSISLQEDQYLQLLLVANTQNISSYQEVEKSVIELLSLISIK